MSKKKVSSGTALGAAERRREEARILRLKASKIRSDNKLIKQMDQIQKKLDKLAHHHRPYDDILTDAVQRYHKQRHVENLIAASDGSQGRFPFRAYALLGGAVLMFTASFYILLSDPSITGAAVTNVSKVAANQFVGTAIGMFTVILILGLTLHTAEYRHKHRHDRFKPPEMLE